MKPNDLTYKEIKKLLSTYEDKGRGESVSFLNWFLENIFRIDSVDADDSICDKPNDRGIDGIYVDHTQEEILILQGKLKQKESTIGDAQLRDLAGTLTQFEDEKSVQALLDGGGNAELKRLIERNNVIGLLSKGYKVKGVFVCNQTLDANGQEFLDSHQGIVVYDRNKISSEFIDIITEGGIPDEFTFDASYVEPMTIRTGDRATTYVLPVKANELIAMSGIDDGTLFSQNVRLSLGNTKVNKALRGSIQDKNEHENFTLYHNGVNILCKTATLDEKSETLTISKYVVVNGAQSISAFKKSREHLSDDLRVLAKITKIEDSALSKKITVNSNNQNAIKPRDLKSTNEIQLRLKEEFSSIDGGKYEFEIKRGQEQTPGTTLITNEEAGRLLLAFDLMEPESCHQIYKVFDDKYSDIFARRAVDAYRIIFLHELMVRIREAANDITFKPLAKYGLTRFFLLSVISELIDSSIICKEYVKSPKRIFDESRLDSLLDGLKEILDSLIIDLNYEVVELGEQFDYKGDLKSPKKIKELRSRLLKSYAKDLKRGKATSLDAILYEET